MGELFLGSYFWAAILRELFVGSYLGGLFLASYFSGAISGELFLGAISGKYVKSSHLDMIRHKRKGARWARAVLVSINFCIQYSIFQHFSKSTRFCKILQKILQNFAKILRISETLAKNAKSATLHLRQMFFFFGRRKVRALFFRPIGATVDLEKC